MKHKVIVADDSLTIQKVIKITLAKEDFELIECLDDSKLYDLCKEVKPTLVLLDFNLSENKTGYDLCRDMKNSDVDKILMLYGTFDTVDEDLLDHCGANGHIVKPFEGSKFVQMCRQLIEDAAEGDEPVAQIDEAEVDEVQDNEIQEDDSEINIDDGWVVNQPASAEVEDKTDEHDMSDFIVENRDESRENELSSAVSDWGIDIPGVIDEGESSSIELPPVISGSNDSEYLALDTHEAEEVEEELSLPKDEELEYPNVEEIKETIKAEPKLTPIDELQDTSAETEPKLEYSLDDVAGTKTEDEIRALEEQIASETEEDLWRVDDEEGEDEGEDEGEGEDDSAEVELSFVDDSEVSNEAMAPTQVEVQTAEVSKEEILKALEDKIEEIVNARVEAIIEKVAWEVIPDLAENLISKELKNLAESSKD